MTTRSLRLIQTGDWHFFANQTTWDRKGYEHRQTCLKKCLQELFRASREADYLLLTGDLIETTYKRADEKPFEWLDKELAAIDKNRIIVTFGSHDDEYIRQEFLSRSAGRKRIGSNVFAIECPDDDVIFYAVDSNLSESKSQGGIINKARDTILNDRKGEHKAFGRAVLLAQLNEKDLPSLKGLNGNIDFAALGDRHFWGIFSIDNGFFSAYAGAPIARDAAGYGDSGPRYYIKTEIKQNGWVAPQKVALKNGGYQVHIIESKETVWGITGPKENKFKVGELSSSPEHLIQAINDITVESWTTMALADSVSQQAAILNYLGKRYKALAVFPTPTRRGNMWYFFRQI